MNIKTKQAAMMACMVWSAGLSADAQAVGISLMEISVSGMGNAYAGSTVEAADASVLFYNPAALTRFKKAEQSVGAVLIQVNAGFQDGPEGSNGAPASITYERDPSYGFAPSNFFVFPVSERLVFGAGISGSAGLILRYPNDYPGRFQSKSTDIKVTRVNLAAAYKLTPQWSIGGNFSVERFFQSIRTDVNFAEAAAVEPGLNGLAGMALTNPLIGNLFFDSTGSARSAPLKLRLFGTQINAQVGTLYEFGERTRLGFSFRPKTKFNLKGKYTFQSPPPELLVAAAPELLSDGEVTQTIVMPSEARASVFHKMTKKLDVMGDITRYDYSGIRNVEYKRADGSTLKNYVQNLRAGNRYAVGMNYRLYERLTLRTGLSHSEATSEDRFRVTALPDQARNSVHLGVGMQLSNKEWLDVAYQYTVFDDAKIQERTDIQGVQGEKSFDGDLNGSVFTQVNYFGVHYRALF
ncbi:MAG TPA: outer membrane protein transport protein [Limnobacter sp.]|nr:outer membrane protein transport protein [Limnobacter sp.]